LDEASLWLDLGSGTLTQLTNDNPLVVNLSEINTLSKEMMVAIHQHWTFAIHTTNNISAHHHDHQFASRQLPRGHSHPNANSPVTSYGAIGLSSLGHHHSAIGLSEHLLIDSCNRY